MPARSPYRLFAALVASVMVSAPLAAQGLVATDAAVPRWSKTDAILGAPSALQAILAQQNAAQLPAVSLQPRSYGTPAFLPAIAQLRPAVTDRGTSGRPDVFGSVALRVAHTPLDGKWHAVENSSVGASAARFAGALRGQDPLKRLEAVNWYINRRVRFVDDSRQFGRADVWSTAADTLRRGRGDCEDYAIAKMQMLRRAGIAERDLYLVIVKDLVRRADHAVLVARADGRMYVLDNGTDEVLDSESVSDYRPVLSFSAAGEWTHGYRVQPPVSIAAADSNQVLVTSAEPQRSRSASLLAFNMGFSK